MLRSIAVNDVPCLIGPLMRLCDGKGSRWSTAALWAADAGELAGRGLHGGLIHDDRNRCSLCRLLTVYRPRTGCGQDGAGGAGVSLWEELGPGVRSGGGEGRRG